MTLPFATFPPALVSARPLQSAASTPCLSKPRPPLPLAMSAADADADEPKGVAPLPGNGGRGDGYSWTQTLYDVTIVAQVPVGTTSKEIHCLFGEKSLSLGLKAADAPRILDGTLGGAVNVDECTWNLDRSDGTVTVYLEKMDTRGWWKCVVEGEPELDISKVEPDNSKLSDLDGETRGMVEKMMFDQRAKAAGLPTSDQLRQQEMLRKFQAQHPEMDFSQAKFQ